MKAHMVKHSERKDFVCDECGKRFKRKDKMREHVKRMHNEERKMKQMQLQKIGAQKLRGTQPNQKSSNQSEDLAVCHPPVGGHGSIIQNITEEPSMVRACIYFSFFFWPPAKKNQQFKISRKKLKLKPNNKFSSII